MGTRSNMPLNKNSSQTDNSIVISDFNVSIEAHEHQLENDETFDSIRGAPKLRENVNQRSAIVRKVIQS